MNKLNAQQILAIVEANYSVENFGYGEWQELEHPENVDLTGVAEEAKRLTKEKNDFYDSVKDKFKKLTWNEREAHPDWIAYTAMPTGFVYKQNVILQQLGLGEVEEVEQTGGEDEGSNWSSVKYFKDHDVYIETCGYYQSYDGTDFDQGYGHEVIPVQVEVTQYHVVG